MKTQLRYLIIAMVLCVMLFSTVGTTSGIQLYPHKAEDPGSYLLEKALMNRIVLVGTHHKNISIHNLIINTLPSLVNTAQMNTLFVEISSSQQKAIDLFSEGKAGVETIEVSNIIASDSYRQILLKARELGMDIIAMDAVLPNQITRDEWMSHRVIEYMDKHPGAKGLVVVGKRHVLKDIQWKHTKEPSLADYLKGYGVCSVITWPEALDDMLPIAMDINPFYFEGVKDPTLMVMNTDPAVSLATAADGVILMPKSR